jgi:hypothetical protein
MWEIIFGVIAFLVGLYLWSTVLGRIMEIKLRKSVNLPLKLPLNITSLIIAIAILTVGSIFLVGAVYGVLISGIVMLVNIRKLRGEVVESIQKEYGHR